VLRLRGGGRPPAERKMAVAAGGRINQVIEKDWAVPGFSPPWDKTRTQVFNVQILDTASFTKITGREAPPTPVSAAHYAQLGLPFFHLEESETDVAGDFGPLQSINELDGVSDPEVVPQTKSIGKVPQNENQKHIPIRTKLGPDFLNPAGPRTEFKSLHELEKELDI